MSGDSVFLDTNFLVYANDTSSPEKREKGRTLMRALISDGSGCISTQVLAEFWVTATQKLKTPLERSIAIHQITLFSAFTVQAVDHATVLAALRLQERYQLSYWDSLIIASASFAQCRILYSEDMQDGAVYDGVTIRNPFKKTG